MEDLRVVEFGEDVGGPGVVFEEGGVVEDGGSEKYARGGEEGCDVGEGFFLGED